jgi:lysozyme
MARAINDTGLGLIKSFEGLRLESYQDVAGIWTIGYGHIKGRETGNDHHGGPGDGVPAPGRRRCRADGRLHLRGRANLRQSVRRHGLALLQYRRRQLSELLRAQAPYRKNSAAAADAFLKWDKAHVDGQLVVVNGLHNRREKEKALYLQS